MRRVHLHLRRPRRTKKTLRKDPERLFWHLYRTLGPQGWWPGDGPLEIAIGAILTQNTNWKNVERAIQNLKDAGVLDLEGLLRLPEDRLTELIRPAGYFRVKARRLRAFLEWLRNKGGFEPLQHQSLEQLRQELLQVYGIGPETADSILLYALNRPVFVIDAYTRRILGRHGVRPGKSYEDYRRWFEQRLPRETWLFNEFHALLVEIGKRYCKRDPQCEGCPVQGVWGAPEGTDLPASGREREGPSEI